MADHDDIAVVALVLQPLEKGTDPLVDLVQRLPSRGSGRCVDHVVPAYPGIPGVEFALRKPFIGPETAFPQRRIDRNGKPERLPHVGRRLPGASKVTGVNCPNPTLPKPLGHLRGLPMTLVGQGGSVRVSLNEAEHIPRALTVAHHQESLVPVVRLVHYS